MDKKSISILLSIFFVLALVPAMGEDLCPNTSVIDVESPDIPILNAATKKYKYVGSEHSNVYHKLTCRYAKKIKSYNKLYFKDKKQARNWGYRACKVCRP